MRVGFWINKATDTHSEYVIAIAFPLQQWLHEGASMLRYTLVNCLSCPNKIRWNKGRKTDSKIPYGLKLPARRNSGERDRTEGQNEWAAFTTFVSVSEVFGRLSLTFRRLTSTIVDILHSLFRASL